MANGDADGLWGLLERRARLSPDRPALRDVGADSLTWAGLAARVDTLADSLDRRGVRPGTVVSWQLPTSVDAVVLLLALSRLGATQNPLLTIYGERELGFVLRQCRPALVVVPASAGAGTGGSLARAAAETAAGEPPITITTISDGRIGDGAPLSAPVGTAGRWYFHTSGTTAAPKGVVHTDRGILAAGRTLVDRLALTPDDRYGAVFPIGHIGGPAWVAAGLLVGFETLCVERFDPEAAIAALAEFRVTIAGAGPPFFLHYLRAQRALPPGQRLFAEVRAFPGGGTGRAADLHGQMVDAFGVGIVPTYGLTEAPIVAMARPGDDSAVLAATEGTASPGAEIRVVRADGRPLAAGDGAEGEIQVRGDHLMIGYLDPELNATAFDEDGWFRTGDLGRLSAEGHLTVTGRIKDTIIRNMENVSAVEVEQVLATHPAVFDVAVIGLPDPRTGERVCAVVVPADPALPPDLAAMSAWCERAGLSRRKWPEQLEIVDDLPRGPAGKVAKPSLRARFLAEGESTPATHRA